MIGSLTSTHQELRRGFQDCSSAHDAYQFELVNVDVRCIKMTLLFLHWLFTRICCDKQLFLEINGSNVPDRSKRKLNEKLANFRRT